MVKIENRDEDIVFTSEEMKIDDWEAEWKTANRRQGVDIEEHECPYNSAGCIVNDLCVRIRWTKSNGSSEAGHSLGGILLALSRGKFDRQ